MILYELPVELQTDEFRDILYQLVTWLWKDTDYKGVQLSIDKIRSSEVKIKLHILADEDNAHH